MKILFIAVIKIEANASAGAETINIYINEFSKQGVQVDVIAKSVGRYMEKNISYHLLPVNNYNEKLRKVCKGLGWIFYPQNKYSYKTSKGLRKDLFDLLKEMKGQGYYPDVISMETTSVLLLYEKIKEIYPKAFLVASMHDVAYQGSARKTAIETNGVKKMIRNRYLKYAKMNEIRAMAAADLIVPQNRDNIQWLTKEQGLERKRYFLLVPYYEKGFQHDDETLSKNLLFYGLMNRPENYESAKWFITHVMNRLSGDYKFIIMGGNPPEHLYKYKSDKVEITGFVPEEEVKKYFEEAMCMVAPLVQGSGIKTKVLSAFSTGLPVLTNDIGIEGITAQNGVNYIHCETEDDYINAIMKISKNRTFYRELCMRAREVVQKGYNHQNCAREYLALLRQNCLDRKRG